MDLMNIGELTSIFFTYREKLTYYNFKDEFPSINLKIEEYNGKIDELKGNVNDFANGIMSLPNFEGEVLERWMKGYTKEEKQKFIIEKDKIIKCILKYIANNK